MSKAKASKKLQPTDDLELVKAPRLGHDGMSEAMRHTMQKREEHLEEEEGRNWRRANLLRFGREDHGTELDKN